MLVWVATSSPRAFSSRGDYVTACKSPMFFFCLSFFLPLGDLLTLAPTHSYLSAIIEQPRARLLPTPFDTLVPAALFVIGQTFIVTSTWSLGITGRFLGDYFGIIMDARVKTFPYNVLRDPIYVGSTMCFAATAFWCVPCSRSLSRTRETI
jgi:protein-S-isoprenylcysteine O-methyltransferase Ste14